MESVSNAGTFVNTVHVQNCGFFLKNHVLITQGLEDFYSVLYYYTGVC
jgi:hypothetical protein